MTAGSVTFERRKWTAKNWAFAFGLAAVGVLYIWLGSSHGGVRTSLTGWLCLGLSVLGTSLAVRNAISKTPTLVLDSEGVHYRYSPTHEFDADWQSLGEFEIAESLSGKRRAKVVQAPIIGSNVSESFCNREPFFVISPKQLDVDIFELLDQLNDLKAKYLGKDEQFIDTAPHPVVSRRK